MQTGNSLSGNPHPLIQHINKDPREFSRADIIRYIKVNNIKMLNFHYPGEDNRLKTLNFVINDYNHLDTLLATGERVDGSSLFSHIEAGSSDLYVVPKYRTAFINPFTEIPTLDILCSYFTKDGEHLTSAPEYVLQKAHEVLKEKTGFSFYTMGELEYYLISPKNDLFRPANQKGYHESAPFSKWEDLRIAALHLIAQCGGKIKYGHLEVGNFSIGDLDYEQNEIEFLPVDVEESAEQLLVAKWIIRNLAYKKGVTATFAPKITTDKAGSGMHIHTQLMKGDKNVMMVNNQLSEDAKKMIAGFLSLAPSLTAFGNTNPTSYFRLVPNQEAPTTVSWGDRNRSVLVRVPLGWTGNAGMITKANPNEAIPVGDFSGKQTVEFRCPDGSANIYLLLAGLTVAARHGLEMENALEYAKETYVDINIFSEEHKEKIKNLETLPLSCWHSAEQLKKQAAIYRQYDVFSDSLIERNYQHLKSFNDKDFRVKLKDNREAMLSLVQEHFHCG
jgi:glutamine synthetase